MVYNSMSSAQNMTIVGVGEMILVMYMVNKRGQRMDPEFYVRDRCEPILRTNQLLVQSSIALIKH